MERITFENYRSFPAINQSLLKTLDKDPRKVGESFEMNDGMEFGDALDLLVFTPELFDEQYYVADLDNLPSDRIKGIIEDVVENHGADGVTDEAVLAAADRDEYGMSWNNSTRLRKILEEGDGARYATLLANSADKRILSIQRHMEIVQAVEILKTHEFTADLLFAELPENMERFSQIAIRTLAQNPHKGLLDLMIVDHEEKIIYPWDLKNIGKGVLYFPSQFIKQRYYLQAALYQHMLEWLVAEAEEGTNVQEFTSLTFNPSGYKVKNFGFIVIGSGDSTRPIRYRCSDEDIYCGMYGGELRNGRPIKGVSELTKELIWHRESGKWDYPYEAYQQNGELKLDVFQ